MFPRARRDLSALDAPYGLKGGGKGGGGGTPRAAQESPNTLRSKTTARVIDLLSEGEIVGLINGARSIFVDGTPLQNFDGTFNFQGITFVERFGLPDQAPIPGFPDIQNEVVVGVEVKFGAPVTRTITDSNTDAVRVTIRIPILTIQNITTGDLRGGSVNMTVDLQSNGGGFNEVINDVIAGKNTAPYERAYRIELTGSPPWDIRVNRITVDAPTINIQDKTFFSRYTRIVDRRLIMPDSAVTGVAVDAEQFNGQVPQRGYEIKGIKVQIPEYYFPEGPTLSNDLLRSEEFDSSAEWVPTNAPVVTANSVTGPDNTASADAVDDTDAVNPASLAQSITVPDDLSEHTFSVHVEDTSGDSHFAMLEVALTGGTTPITARATIDTNLGTVVATQSVESTGTEDVKRFEGDSVALTLNVPLTTTGKGFLDTIVRELLMRVIGPASISSAPGVPTTFTRYHLTAKNNLTGNTTLTARLYPATNTDGTTTIVGVTTGAKVFWGAQAVNAPAPGFYRKTTTAPVSDVDISRPRFRRPEIWDGTFKTGWTNNPAWVFNDILTNSRYGLGAFIAQSQVDKFALEIIAQYCDELVDDGFGGKEPRFTFNGVMNTREEAFQVIQALASNFRAMAFWATGSVTAKQDSPEDATKLVTPANVVDGVFTYEGSDLAVRHTAALVTWNDPEDGYRTAIEAVEDQADIQKFGFRPAEILAVGTTSQGQAHRLGKWLLDTERTSNEIVKYVCGFDHADVAPGAIVSIADPAVAGIRNGGRVASATLTTLTLDSPIDLPTGPSTSTVSVIMSDGTLESRTITDGIGSFTTITLDTALPNIPLVGAMYVVTSPSVSPREFRIISIAQQDKNLFEVTALLHDPAKFARIEQDVVLEPPPFSVLGPTLAPPGTIDVTEFLFRDGPNILAGAVISWEASTDPRVVRYEVQVKAPGEQTFVPLAVTVILSVDFREVRDGVWEFQVAGIDSLGKFSAFTPSGPINLQGLNVPPSDVTGFIVQISVDTAHFQWDSITDLDLSHYELRYASATTGATWGSADVLVERIARNTQSVAIPVAVGTYFLKAVDTNGNESVNAISILNFNPGSTQLNAVSTIQEEPGFAGTHVNTFTVESELYLDGHVDDHMDDWTTLDVVQTLLGGVTGVNPTGTYQFQDTFDLGAIFISRITAKITKVVFALGVTLSSFVPLASAVPLSGAASSLGAATVQERNTNDDPGGSPTFTDWANLIASDIRARAFQFRVQLKSSASNVGVKLSLLHALIDQADRVIRQEDVSVPSGGLTVSYSAQGGDFFAKPALVITGQNMATGDYLVITSQSKTGFTMQFKDSTDTGVARTADWVAVGFGKKVT